jgi:hypothetical protein
MCPGARLARLPLPGGAPPSDASYGSPASLVGSCPQLNRRCNATRVPGDIRPGVPRALAHSPRVRGFSSRDEASTSSADATRSLRTTTECPAWLLTRLHIALAERASARPRGGRPHLVPQRRRHQEHLLTVTLNEVLSHRAIVFARPDGACQRPSVSPQRRPANLPTGGHVFSPLVAIGSPRLRWRSGRRGAEPVGRGGAAIGALRAGQVRGVTPLPAVAWASR